MTIYSKQNTRTIQELKNLAQDVITSRFLYLDFAKSDLLSDLNIRTSRVFGIYMCALGSCKPHERRYVQLKIRRLGQLSKKLASVIQRDWKVKELPEEMKAALINQTKFTYSDKTAKVIQNAFNLFEHMANEKYQLQQILLKFPKRKLTKIESKQINDIVNNLKIIQKNLFNLKCLPLYTMHIQSYFKTILLSIPNKTQNTDF
jgi:uncharacterized protein YecA (UPF0149 family)